MSEGEIDLEFAAPQTSPADVPGTKGAVATSRQAAFADYPGPVLVISPTGEISAGNAAAVPFLAFATDDQLAEVQRAARALRDREPVPECLLRALEAGGRLIVCGFTLVPLPKGAGILAFGREISDEVGQRDRLLGITRSLRTLLDFSCQFAWETNADGQLSFIAPRQVIGFKAAKLVGKLPAEIFSQSTPVVVKRLFSTREPVRNVALKGIAGDEKPIEMIGRAQPILDATGDWIGARGVLDYASPEDERRFAADRSRDLETVRDALRRIFTASNEPQDRVQQTCAEAADALNSAGAAAYVLDPRSASFRRVAWHGPVDASSVDLCARPFLDRLTDGRPGVDGRKYRRQVLVAASRSERDLVGALVCWREEDEESWTDAERELAQEIAELQTPALGTILRISTSAAPSRGAPTNDLAAMTGTIDSALIGRPPSGEEPSLLCISIDNVDAVSTGDRSRLDDLIGMFGLIIRRAAGNGQVAQLDRSHFTVWLPSGGTARARQAAETCLKLVDPLRPKGANKSTIGLSIGIAVAQGGRFQAFADIQKDALKAAQISRQSGGHSYTFA